MPQSTVDDLAVGNVTVRRIPEDRVEAERIKKEEQQLADQRMVFDKIKKNEANVVWRENLARERIVDLENEAKVCMYVYMICMEWW